MPLDDRQIIAGQKLVREKTRAEKKIEYLKELSTKMHVQGLSTPESAAEISRLEKDVKNMESTLTKMRKNIMTVATNLPGETFLGKIDRVYFHTYLRHCNQSVFAIAHHRHHHHHHYHHNCVGHVCFV